MAALAAASKFTEICLHTHACVHACMGTARRCGPTSSCRYQLMSLVDGSNSQVYKQKLKNAEKSAIKKAPGDSAYMALSDL